MLCVFYHNKKNQREKYSLPVPQPGNLPKYLEACNKLQTMGGNCKKNNFKKAYTRTFLYIIQSQEIRGQGKH